MAQKHAQANTVCPITANSAIPLIVLCTTLHAIKPSFLSPLVCSRSFYCTNYSDLLILPSHTPENELIRTMAAAIGTASGLVGLGTAACGGIVSLYKLIQSFRHHPKHVRDLMQGLEELQGILESLTKTIESDNGIDLSALELPLRRCISACKEFE